MPAPSTRLARRLVWLAALTAGCSDPRAAPRTGQAGPAFHALPTQDVWALVQAADFNGDGLQDVLWNNADHSEMAVTLLRGTELLEEGARIPGPPGPEWVTVIAVDFDGDGMADVIWSDTGRNLFSVWLMRGTEVAEVGPEIPGPAGRGWSVSTLADFNFDGMNDILWYNDVTGGMAVWLMRGVDVLERGREIAGPPGTGWSISNAADFDRDGMADVLWNDTVGNRIAVWLMRGTCLADPGPVLPGPEGTDWVAASAGDTNGDGMADVTWQTLHPPRLAVWLMCGTGVLERGAEIPGPS
jgi:FG-GAP-like repeat